MSEKTQTDRAAVAPDQNEHLSQRLKVLVIDDNEVCRKVLAFNLRKCGYDVDTTEDALKAIDKLKENKNEYDVVLTDVVRSDMDGFDIVKTIGCDIGIPVIMTSANSDIAIIDKGVRHGALDFLVKPVPVEILKNIWQHVVRKKMNSSKNANNKSEDDDDVSENANKNSGKDDDQSTCSTGEDENSKKKSENSKKRSRAEWTHELRAKFAEVVRRLEVNDKVVPKNILKMMNVPNLTRQQVASYLQKFRINEEQQNIEQREKLRRLSETSAMYSYLSVFSQTQPLQHQNLMPSLQYSDPTLMSSGLQYNPMEIHSQARHFGALAPSSNVDGISNYCDWQTNVGIKMEQPYPPHPRSEFLGGFASHAASVIQPDNNVVSGQSYASLRASVMPQGLASQGSASVVLPNNIVGSNRGFASQGAYSNVGSTRGFTSPYNNVGSTQMKSELMPAATMHAGSTPNYLPVSYEQRIPVMAEDPHMSGIMADFTRGVFQAQSENVTFKSEENHRSSVYNQASIFDEDNFRDHDDILNDLDLHVMMQGFPDQAPSLCDESFCFGMEGAKDASFLD